MDKSSEAWRAECEAQHVLRLPKLRRLAYYEFVKNARGEKAAKELIGSVNLAYKKSMGA